MTTASNPGAQLRLALQTAQAEQRVLPFVGIYDLFSASLAANHFEALFLSGFGLAASAYGLPDIGFIGWGDLTSTTSRLRALLPNHHLLVDIDDGFGDPAIAGHVVCGSQPGALWGFGCCAGRPSQAAALRPSGWQAAAAVAGVSEQTRDRSARALIAANCGPHRCLRS